MVPRTGPPRVTGFARCGPRGTVPGPASRFRPGSRFRPAIRHVPASHGAALTSTERSDHAAPPTPVPPGEWFVGGRLRARRSFDVRVAECDAAVPARRCRRGLPPRVTGALPGGGRCSDPAPLPQLPMGRPYRRSIVAGRPLLLPGGRSTVGPPGGTPTRRPGSRYQRAAASTRASTSSVERARTTAPSAPASRQRCHVSRGAWTQPVSRTDSSPSQSPWKPTSTS
jgi:hypothetical protein